MTKNLTAFFGVLVLTFSIWFNIDLRKGERNALSLNNQKTSYGIIMGPPQCGWEVSTPENVMSENKTQAIVINTNNPNTEPCETLLYLRAPNFDMSPPRDEQKIALNAISSGSISWIITPRKTGSFEIAITDNLNTKIFGITVKNMYGLSTMQAKIVSILGTIFGPMLTIPWWWDRLRKKNI